jgi:hypothetical protein
VPAVQSLLIELAPPTVSHAWLIVTAGWLAQVTTASPVAESAMVPTVFPEPSLMVIAFVVEVESKTIDMQTAPFFLKVMAIAKVLRSKDVITFEPSE